MSTPEQRAGWAAQTEWRTQEARTAEINGMYAEIEALRESVEQWRTLCLDLIRAGAQLPKQGATV